MLLLQVTVAVSDPVRPRPVGLLQIPHDRGFRVMPGGVHAGARNKCGHVIGLELDGRVEIGERQVGFLVLPVSQPAFVEVTRLRGSEFAGAGEIGDRALLVVPGVGGRAAPCVAGRVGRLIEPGAGVGCRRRCRR